MRPLQLFFFILALLTPQIIFASQSNQPVGDKSIIVEGYGSSKQDALLQAKRAAVEDGIGVILSSQTEVENFVLKKDKIITQSFGAVKNYSLLKEELQGDTWYVKIKATVSLDSIHADLIALKILLISMDKPRMMVLIQEDDGQYSESAIVDYLQSKKFDLIDPTQIAVLMEKDDPFVRKAMKGDPIAAARLGAENGAEYIVVGKVRKSLFDNTLLNNSGMKSGQASITVKVINCSNGRIITTKSATGAAVHVTEETAMGKAAALAATNLMDKQLFEAIVSSFQDTVNNGANFEVTIVGIKNYRKQKQTTKLLQQTPGVVSVTKRSFGDGKLELTVLFKGSVETFCDTVDSTVIANDILTVTDIKGNRIVLNVQAHINN